MVKKFLSLMLIFIIFVTVLTGCINTNKQSELNNDKDILRVGIDLKYYPFMYLDEDEQPTGLEVDISNAFGEYIGKKVEIVNTDFSMLIPALETGDVDIVISDMSSNDERKQKVDFSIPYRYGRTLALVNKDYAEKNNITNEMSEEEFFNIEGTRFIGLAGTISVSVPQSFGKNVTEITEIASGIMEVSKGKSDVLIGDNTIRGDYAANKDTTVIYDGISDYSESCFAVKKGNTQLLEKANDFINSMYAEDGFYMQAGTKYDEVIGEFMKDNSLGLDYIIYPPSEERVKNE